MRITRKKSLDPRTARADLLIVTLAQPDGALDGPAAAVDEALGGVVASAVEAREVTGKPGSLALFHAADGLGAPRVAVVGRGTGDAEGWRTAGAAAAKRATQLRAESVVVALPDEAGAAEARAFAEGVGRGAYRYDRFRTADDEDEPRPAPVRRLTVAGGSAKAADLARAERTVAAVDAARDLGNTPASHLTPSGLAAHAQALADATPGLECTVLDEKALRRLGAGALLGVARGSYEPPRMIVLRYRPRRVARPGQVLGLVGKAVTFDSGGISIKPSGGMEDMKLDMAGGAAVIEGAGLVAALGLPVEVLAVVPSTENLPSGRSLKPGDVLTAMNGKTIEVINTDAEGRLILADALVHATRQGATRLLDMATLTGAILVALGETFAGLFGSDPEWTAQVKAASEASGELVWELPLHPDFAPLIKSKVADLSNSSNKRLAGSIYAAQFLREFTGGTPWCHLDVAGTAMVGGAATGFGVRLIAALAESQATPA